MRTGEIGLLRDRLLEQLLGFFFTMLLGAHNTKQIQCSIFFGISPEHGLQLIFGNVEFSRRDGLSRISNQ